ncbi:MAG: hypothetical protein U1E20_10130 [Methylocystis sp.]|uniref:hypothetical protein n=1 Tax=Methylocystis sp. TaxID=1911079 RepID=UPI00395FC7B0
MKFSIAAASTAVAAIALVLSGAAPAAAKATTVSRQKAGAKLDCTSLPDCRQVMRGAKKRLPPTPPEKSQSIEK